jgi:hypothetical protein
MFCTTAYARADAGKRDVTVASRIGFADTVVNYHQFPVL